MAVVKISARGDDPGGLVRYLFGKGKSNEHTNQRTVAGTCQYARAGQQADIKQAHGDLRAYSKANPQVSIKGGHVWQASITLPPGDAPLSDAKWKAIADDYMTGMGFTNPSKSPVRWTAVNHGLNTGGSDHIHIVMSMVREDGSRVSIHNDAIESSKVMKDLEKKHGLTQLQGRGAGTTARTFTGGEKGKAEDKGHEIERVEIERIVRGAAGASTTEAEFVRRLRDSGMDIRPRVAGDVVTGYSIGMPGANVHFPGGKIARDLTLPRLRLRWGEQPAGTDAAALEWIHGKAGQPLVATGRETRQIPVSPAAVTKELQAVQQAIPAASTLELREIAQDLSGALALGAKHDPALAKMSRDTGRWAQTRSYNFRPKHRLMNVGLLVLQASDPLSPMGTAILLKQVLSTLQTLHELHRAQCQVRIGKGKTMTHPAPDDGISEPLEGLAVVGVTMGAQAVQRALYNKKQGLAEQEQLAGDERGNQHSRTAPARSGPPVYRGLSAQAAHGEQVRVLSQALGTDLGVDGARVDAMVGNMTRLEAQDHVLGLQFELGNDRAKEVLHAAGLPYIASYRGENNQEYTMVWPVKEMATVGAPAPDGGQQQTTQTPRSPRAWEADPMSPRQRITVTSYARNAGLDAVRDLDGFDSWTKGDADAAIKEFQKGRHSPEGIKSMLTPDAQVAFDPTKIKPRTTAVRPGAGPISGEDIRNQRGRGGR